MLISKKNKFLIPPPLTGDVTVVCPLADSHVAIAARETRSVFF